MTWRVPSNPKFNLDVLQPLSACRFYEGPRILRFPAKPGRLLRIRSSPMRTVSSSRTTLSGSSGFLEPNSM